MEVSKQKTCSYQENKRILSRSYASKEEFLKEYKRLYGKAFEAKEFYLFVLTELDNAVSVGDVNSFKRLSNLIDYTSELTDSVTLTDYYDNVINPIRSTNLIILASKHNKLNILQYLLEGDSEVLNNLSIGIGKTAILPEDADEVGRNAFYYAIRSGNTQLLDILIRKWPGNYFTASSGELEAVLSKAYEELRLKNVPLPDEMESFVENELINLRFFSNASEQDPSPWGDINKTRERIALVLELIGFLTTNYSNTEEVNGRFIFVAKFIAQNIHILKQRLKSTYVRLPWEEMEFCLIIFISLRTKLQELNLFYRAILNKTKILKYLRNFANELGGENDITRGDKLNCLPRGQKRENVVAKIIDTYPQFAELYYDYDQIRDIYSLEKISDNIKLTLLADPQEKEGQLIITRVLQVIGENMKNTLQSPNLSHTASELLFISLPKDTRKIITGLRDAISHADALSTRIQIEEKADSFFINVQNDIKKLGNVINGILYKIKIKIVRILLTKIVNSKTSDEMKEVLQELDFAELVHTSTEYFKTMEHEKLEKLIKQLSDNIADKTNYENELFLKINSIINCAGTESEIIRSQHIVTFANLRMYSKVFGDNNPNIIKLINNRASMQLESIGPNIEHGRLNKIGELLGNIFHSLRSRLHDAKLDEVNRLTWEIIYFAEYRTNCINWIEELREQLGEKDTHQQQKAYNLTADIKYQKLLELKLSELKSILSKNTLTGPLGNASGFHKKEKEGVTAVEMLVLDIVEILDTLKDSLENTFLFLDDHTPLLNGKCLRNYLAHDNVIVDVLLSDPSRAVFLNAEKLVEENIMRNERKIGKLVRDDPVKLRKKFHQSLITITNQERMFVSLEEGDLDSLQDCLLKGADIKARSVNLWTTLHFAAKGSSLEIVKFILDHNLNPNVKDNDGQTPLHVAAAYGRKEIVDFFVTEAGLCVDELTKHDMTPLHFAAKNGHKDTVEILLKNKANTSAHDTREVLPLHYAIMNNHISVTKILLEKEKNLDINEVMDDLTPLHVAAGHGHCELVKFFLEIGANINATSDNNTTPLHLSVQNSHLEVLEVLILNGANVNTGVIINLTPLHCAAYWGNIEITNILLQHGAYVNASVSAAERFTPLHFAIQSGHLEIVAALVKYGADVNPKSRPTPLHLAAACGLPEVTALLIKKGADINTKRYHNITPLHVAAHEGHKEVAHLLIKNKAEVNTQDVEGATPLHAAASIGSKDILDLLIKNGADVNAKSIIGITPLGVAVTEGHEAAVNFLIKNKALVNNKDKEGHTPLHLAVLKNYKNIVNLLIENKAQVHEEGIGDCTPLHIAAGEGHKEIVEILVLHGANVNDKSYVVTPLLNAIKCNHKEIVKVLITNGANVSSGDIEAWSIPAFAGYNDIVKILLKNPEYVNYKNLDHATPLHFAAKGGQKRIAKALIDKGADIDAVTINNITPVFVAAKEGYDEVVMVLLAYGANVNIKSKENVTPLHIAAIEGHSNVVKVLLDYKLTKSDIKTSLQSAVRRGHLEVVKMLVQYKIVHMDAKGNDDLKLLHIASQGSNLKLIKYLVDQGFDINARNLDGLKPIHIAADKGFKETVEFFLSIGLSITDSSVFNITLLHCAARKGHLEIVKYLIDKGADVNVQDTNGSTPMHMAACFGNKDVIDILIRNGAVYNTVDRFFKTPLKITNNRDVGNLLSLTAMLFKAVKRNDLTKMQRYIKAGAFVSAKNAESQTPLHYAARKGYDDVVNVLLKNKANPNVADNEGITPLHCAAKFSHLKIVKALLSNYAVYDAVSVDGKTPSDLTVDESITSLFKLVSKAFKNISDGNSRVIDDLSTIKDINIVKSIMRARNRENKTLIVAAIHTNFSEVQLLKEINQGDVSTKIIEAKMLFQLGHYQKALDIFEGIFEIRKEILGSDNPGTFDIQKYIVEILRMRGAYKEALETSEEIFRKEKEILGLNNKDTLNTKYIIATVMHNQGKYEEAFNIYQEVYQKRKEILGPNHSDTFNTQLAMASELVRQGKYEEALYINKSIYEKIKGTINLTVLRVQNNIASVLTNQGNYEEALDMYKAALKMAKVVLGINHAETLTILCDIAGVLCRQKKYHKSLKAYQDVLNIQKNVLEPNHPHTLNTQFNIGLTLFLHGKFISALKAYKKCLNQTRVVFGSNHPRVSDILKQIEKINLVFKMQSIEPSEFIMHLPKKVSIVACKGDIHTLQNLLDDGVDANDKDIDGRTLLHYAVYNGHIDIVNMLLKYGADVTQASNKGNTTLHTATSKGYKEILEVLLQHISHNKLSDVIDAKTTASGVTALHIAAKNGYLDITKSLLKRGAIYDIKNNQGKTPLDLSTDQNVINVLKIVEELFEDAKIGNVEVIDKLRLLKTDDEFLAATHAQNNQQHTLLQVVIVNSHSELANKLLEELNMQKKYPVSYVCNQAHRTINYDFAI